MDARGGTDPRNTTEFKNNSPETVLVVEFLCYHKSTQLKVLILFYPLPRSHPYSHDINGSDILCMYVCVLLQMLFKNVYNVFID